MPEFTTRRELMIWLAGFFDGEGCITTSIDRYGDIKYLVSVGQNSVTPLEVFREAFGGSVLKHGNGKSFQWKAYSGRAAEAVKELLPFLMVKHAQALTFLELIALRPGQGRHMTSDEREASLRLVQELKDAKHSNAS